MEFWAQHSHTLDKQMSSLMDELAGQLPYLKLLHPLLKYKQPHSNLAVYELKGQQI
jgi:hypothetical protein